MRARLCGFRAFWHSDSATSAVEFALVLPLMILLVFSGFELSRMSAVSRKVTLTTRAVADLTTRNVALSTASMNVILNASAQIFAPYPNTGMTIVVSELSVNAAGVATVVWSQPLNGTALPTGQVQAIPASIAQPSSYIILCKVTYAYQSVVTKAYGASRTFSDQIYMSPRLSSSISMSG